MKKTIFTILGVGLLALTSCAGGLSVQEIKAKAEEIKTHNTASDLVLPTKYDVLTVSSQTVTTDGVTETAETVVHGIYSEEDYYFYMSMSSGDENMIFALYVEGSTVVFAAGAENVNSMDMGTEEIARLAYTEAFAELAFLKESLDSFVLGIDVLDTIIASCDFLLEQESASSQEEGEEIVITITGSSNKEGCLKVEGTQHATQETSSADITFSVEFVDYYLSSYVSGGTVVEEDGQMSMQSTINIHFEPELIYLPTESL